MVHFTETEGPDAGTLSASPALPDRHLTRTSKAEERSKEAEGSTEKNWNCEGRRTLYDWTPFEDARKARLRLCEPSVCLPAPRKTSCTAPKVTGESGLALHGPVVLKLSAEEPELPGVPHQGPRAGGGERLSGGAPSLPRFRRNRFTF